MRLEQTRETYALIDATSVRTESNAVRTCASCARTSVAMHHRQNFAPIDRRSRLIPVKYAVTATIFEET
jgi:hypothetical protein